jgi:replicative DNA helicase
MALVPALDLRPAGDPRDGGDEPPANVEAEQALLGAILYDPTALMRITVELSADVFFEPFHGRLWTAIGEYVRDGDTPDPTLLNEEFRTDLAYQELGGTRYLADMIDRAPPAVRAGDYARHVLDLHHKRRLIALYADQIAALRAGRQIALDIIDQTELELAKIRVAAAEPGALMTARDSAIATLQEIYDDVASGEKWGRPLGVKTGLQCFDHRMGGLPKTWLIAIGGRPAMGKTALARAALYRAADLNQHRTFAFFTLEMMHRELSERALSATTVVQEERDKHADSDLHGSLAVQTSVLSRSNVGWTEKERLERAAQVQPTNLFVIDQPRLGLNDVRRHVWALKAKGDLAAIAIDYLQLMQREEVRGRNDAALIGDITTGLKQLAMEAQICILLVSQLNRNVDGRDDKRPVLADLRESGSIEQDANAVMFPYREAYYLIRSKPEGSKAIETWEMHLAEVRNLMVVHTAKLRQGEPGFDDQRYRAEFDLVTEWTKKA